MFQEDSTIVSNYDDITRGRVEPGSNVAVVGGQQIGMAIAEFLADSGSRVTVVEATGMIGADLEFLAQKLLSARVAASNHLELKLNTNVEAIGIDGVTVQTGGRTETLAGIDQAIIAHERDMNRDLHEEAGDGRLEELGIEFHSAGDCVWPGEPYDAVLSGYNAAAAI